MATGHLVPWTGAVPRRDRDRDDGLNGGRYSDAYAFNDDDLPSGILADWKGWAPEHLSNPRTGQIKGRHLSNPRRDKSKGHLSNFKGVFVQNSGGICPAKIQVVPENIESATPPTEYNLLNIDSVESDSGGRKDSKAAPTVNGHNIESAATAGKPKIDGRTKNNQNSRTAILIEDGNRRIKKSESGATQVSRARAEPRLPLTEHVLKIVNEQLLLHEFVEYGACGRRA